MSTARRAAATALVGPLAVGAVGGAMIAFPPPAMAEIYGDYRVSGVAIRAGASTSSTVHGRGYPGQGVTSWCWKYGETVGGTNGWDYHTNQTTGVVGYSSLSVLTFQNRSGLPQC